MFARSVVAALALALLAAPQLARAAGSVEGTLTVTKAGQPANARWSVIYLEGFTSSAPSSVATVSQQGRAFLPPVIGVVKGQKVSFLNDEPNGMWHHVFSPGPVTKFDLSRYKAGEHRKQEFDKVGRVDIFCDIHKEMIATVWVLPNSSFQIIDKGEGTTASFKLDGVPPGSWKLVAWNRAATDPVEVPVVVKDGASTHQDVKIEEGTSPLEQLLAQHKRLGSADYPDSDKTHERENQGW